MAVTKREVEKILKELKKRQARKTLIDFTKYTFPKYEVNWHHKVLADYLDKFVNGNIKRLLVSMPPRHGKSELVSRRLPAYILGKNPNASIIASSYGASLASMMNRDVQRIIDDEKYIELFPETRLFSTNVRTVAQGTWLRNSEIFEIVNYKGVYKNAGVGGSLTGMGCMFGLIDDPIKNRAEASSVIYQNSIWDWYISTFYTRLEKDASILLTMTRWHEDDLTGRLIAKAKEDPNAEQWIVLNFPAIAEGELIKEDPREEGQALWVNKFNEQKLQKTKINSSYEWSALYQGKPSSPEGELLKRYWWKFWHPEGMDLAPITLKGENGQLIFVESVALPKRFNKTVQSWDMAFKDSKDSSFVVGQVWGKDLANKYLLDQTRAQIDFVKTLVEVKLLTSKWPQASTKWIEDKANGTAVINTLKREVSGLIPVLPDGSKEARASAVSPQIEAGNVYLPHPSIASWVWDFIEECATFPNAAHDDQVDAMSQALSRLEAGENDIQSFDFALDTFKRESPHRI